MKNEQSFPVADARQASAMDRPRPGRMRRKVRNWSIGLLVVGALALASWRLLQLEPAAPAVDRASLWIGSVELGAMTIEVRGPGTLVPEEVRWVAAPVSGRVERIFLLPGATVDGETVLLRLDNPELEREALDAELQLRQAEAELKEVRVELENAALAQEATAAAVSANYQQSRLQTDLNRKLAEEGLVSDLTLKLSEVTTQELAKRYSIEQRRLDITDESSSARLAAKEARISQLRGLLELRQRQVGTLQVRAGIAGVLQQTPVEVGQLVQAGEILGKVAVPGRLKAELRIPETQAKDVQAGLPATIDTRNGLIEGRVVRIDPAAQEGTVRLEVVLTGELPPGARPDLNVDGTIEIERLENVLKMARPVYGQPGGTIRLFKLTGGGEEAVQVPVRLGRSSVTTIQVLEGLEAGDQVILSDASAWSDFERIRLD